MTQLYLAAVIQAIQMEGWTGLFIVKRTLSNSQEEGRILFINGQMQESRAERRTGFAAFTYLCAWENYEISYYTPDGEQPSLDPLSLSEEKHTSAAIPLSPVTVVAQMGQPNSKGEQTESSIPCLYASVPFHSKYKPSIALQIIEKLGLTRGHRRLFLLIDGKRSVSDLARLMGCTSDEAYQLLLGLERATVIRLTKKV